MDESTLIALLSGSAIGVVLTIGVLVAWRYARGSRELGSDGEHATYRTLHLASQAAENLRGGLDAEEVSRAARHLRALLGCDILAIADAGGAIVIDGPGERFREFAASIAERMSDASRTQVVPVPKESGSARTYAIAAPIVTDGLVAGMVIVFATSRRPPLIRATGEVAAWVSAQLSLGELDASRAALAEAELRALRAQISPHFIYNALNAIASFINTDPSKARELVLEFADFTRYSFRRHGDFTTLAEELRSIDRYLLLERARFGERLQVVLRVAPEVLPVAVPYLCLQPLVENAVQHGLEHSRGHGTVTVIAQDDGAQCRITVEDDGAGSDPERIRQVLAGTADGDSIGMANVDARLRAVYGDDHGLLVETALGAGTKVTIRVPKWQAGVRAS